MYLLPIGPNWPLVPEFFIDLYELGDLVNKVKVTKNKVKVTKI